MLKKISCAVIDDEPLASDLLERYVRKTPFLEFRYKFQNAIEALSVLQNERIDLLFVDIRMPELSGLEFSHTLKKETKVIFTTAFSEYAVEGYKVNALDYLLKPISYEEFLRAAFKANEWFEELAKRKPAESERDTEYIFVKSGYKQVRILFSQVLYFEGLKDYIKIWIKDSPKPVMTIMSLKSLENILPESKFMRIHRSYIVALNKIAQVERNHVIINNVKIPVAEQSKKKFHIFLERQSIR